MRVFGLCVTVTVALAIAGCASIPPQNDPLTKAVGDSGYRLSNTPPGKNNSDSMFVVLAFSGGGTRAAAFSYGVLEKLRDTEIVWEGEPHRLLDEVDVITSVSGGSLPAAYYGLFGDRIFEDFLDKVLCRNIGGDFMKQVFAPLNMVKLFSPRFGRTDILAKMFTSDIFEGKTFADLIAKNERPFLVINSTNIALGSRFEFTQQQFDLLNSDLASYPIGFAVAASSAYPGYLTPVTLTNYPKGPDFHPPAWIAEEERRDDPSRIRYPLFRDYQSYLKPGSPYIHLVDGGVSDNLGILPVIQFAGGALPSDSIQIDAKQIDAQQIDAKHVELKKFVIILVNAKQPGPTEYNTQQKVVNVFKVLLAAGEKPMTNFSTLETAYLRTYIRTLTERQRLRDQITNAFGEEEIKAKLPGLPASDTDYSFIEVAFDTQGDEQALD
ncbi:MAG: patatin-like phospholipase family protein, partial [Candidatus Hydrogenedentales bacterium]